MPSKHILGFALSLSAAAISLVPLVMAQAPPAQQPSTQARPKTQAAIHKAQPFSSEGERIFAQNCSRCHNTPEGFSPRISGTIVRHMRVRAQLSQHDEQQLLRFFNP